MTEVYDLVLNFCDAESEMFNFYEWQKKDKLTYINKIPLLLINNNQMTEILTNIIRIDKSLLLKIKNKTITENEIIPYCLLVTDLNRAIVLKFNKEGILEARSSLLLDEEEAVIEEIKTNKISTIEYDVIKKITTFPFLTRKDKTTRAFLLKKIKSLYNNEDYDEIDYLYQEISSNKQSIKKEYNYLIDKITNNYTTELSKLSDIIKLVVNNN